MSLVWTLLLLLPVLGAGERFSCRGRILGGYYADVKSGCRAFHVCVRVAGGGVRDFRFYCPPGTRFTQEAQVCTDWGEDADALACPAGLYPDGQFDLYKIGSGFDTKKVDANPRREEETEFSLQRAETGDRRLHQSPAPPQQPQPQSDLRAAHSSDFFSGRRDRGQDEPATAPPPPSPSTRAPYRRPPPRATPTPTTLAPPPPQPSAPASPAPFEPQPKRKLVRKRPIHSSTAAPSEYTTASKQYFRSTKPDYERFTATQQSPSEATRSSYNEDSGFVDVIKVSPKAVGRYDAPSHKPTYNVKSGLTEVYNYNVQSTPNYNNINKNNNFNNINQNNNNNNQNTNVNNQNKNFETSTGNYNRPNPNANYQNANFNQNNGNFNNNYNSNDNSNVKNQNTNFNNQNVNLKNDEQFNNQQQKIGRSDTRTFKATVRNNFNVAPLAEFSFENDVGKNIEVSPNGVQRQNNNFNDKSTRNIGSSTPAYRNFNSVSYDSEKNLNAKQHFVNTPTTPDYEKNRNTAPLNINTVAYKTNVGFNARPINYAESEEDDGQYRLPSGEDDGQYRPELYERDSELLSGAHSLNIAASGNRLPEDQKPRRPTPPPSSQTAAPRPFSAAVASSTQPPRPTENVQPSAYPTTPRQQLRQQQFQQTEKFYHSYSSTGKPEQTAPTQTTFEYSNSVFTTKKPLTHNVQTSTQLSSVPSVAPQAFGKQKESAKPAPAQKKYQQPQPAFAKPVKSNKEDSSYDYAYYDSDPGLSEYEQIEEFERTKAKL